MTFFEIQRESWSHLSPIKKENLLNELKGHLFEYQVASQLARIYSCEENFLSRMDSRPKEILTHYQQIVREYDIELFRALPHLAQQTAQFINENLSLKHQVTNVTEMTLLGKTKGVQKKITTQEGDLGLSTDRGFIPISLKLCKSNSFVNTKNGGIQSFIYNYFPFALSENYQEELNHFVESSFYQLANDLYLMAGWPPQSCFDEQWKEHYSELPGELPETMRERVWDFYDQVRQKLFHFLLLIQEEDQALFRRSLYPLWGIGRSDLIQVKCFHGENGHQKHQIKKLKWCDHLFLQEELEVAELLSLRPKISSFLIKGRNSWLQIRVKPMNRFTVLGLKVNCSVKEL